MPFVKCSVDGCNQKLQPVLKPDPRNRETWLYRECDMCLRPACEKHSTEVGGQYEYPLRVMLGADGATRVRQVGVRNRSAVYETGDGGAPPCAVICARCAKHADRMAPYAPGRAEPAIFDDVAVFLPLPGRE